MYDLYYEKKGYIHVIMDFSITFERGFETAHRFMHSCESSCMTPHGHSWKVRFTFIFNDTAFEQVLKLKEGYSNEYIQLKKTFTTFIKNTVDHSILLNSKDKLITFLKEIHPKVRILPFYQDPTTELIALHFLRKLYAISRQDLFYNKIKTIRVNVIETPVNSVQLESSFEEIKNLKYKFPAWAIKSDPYLRRLEYLGVEK